MIENYLTAIIYILLIALVITAIIAFALIVVLTIVLSKQQKKKHISALARVKCAFFINGNHIFVDPYFPIL